MPFFMLQFWCMDNKHHSLEVNSTTTAQEICRRISERVDLGDISGWGLFDSDGQTEVWIKPDIYIADIISQWEFTLIKQMEENTQKREPSRPKERKLLFKKRVFKNPTEIITNPSEHSLLYSQISEVYRESWIPAKCGVSWCGGYYSVNQKRI
jgi:hypothetical protein